MIGLVLHLWMVRHILILSCTFGFLWFPWISEAQLLDEWKWNEPVKVVDNKDDLVQPDEMHLEGVPIFLQEPKPEYATSKGKPATVTCIAEPASHVMIKCAEKPYPYMGGTDVTNPNGLRVERLNSQGLPDPEGHRWKFSVKVRPKEVLQWFDRYECQCEAWNKVVQLQKVKKVLSKKGAIIVNFFNKNFKQVPVDVSQNVGSQVILQCTPPEAQPPPKVHWQKDGSTISPKDKAEYARRIIIDDYHQLIIQDAQLIDSGNYTCVAESLGEVRESPPARVKIHVNGGWSEWSDWTVCDAQCRQKRTRQCSDPRPKNGGSSCSPETDGEQIRNCTIQTCPNKNVIARYINERNTPIETRKLKDARNVAMYVGLAVAFIVFITVVVVIAILILRRKNLTLNTPRVLRYANGTNGCRQEKDNKKANELLLPPDLTQTVVTIKNPNAVDVQPHYKSSGPESLYRVAPPLPPPPASSASLYMSIDGMKQLMLNARTSTQPTSLSATNQGSVITGLGGGGSHCGPAGRCEEMGDGAEEEDKSRPTSALYHELSLGRGSQVLANFIPSHLDVDAVAWGTFNSAGGRLCLPQSGISLTIPQGAIPSGVSEGIFLAVCRDDNDRPRLSDKQTLLSPVVLCGPPEVRLLKSAILSLPHCASLNHGGWQLTVLNSESAAHDSVYWKPMVTLGCETLNTPAYCQLDSTTLHLMTDHLQRYALAGESLPGCQALKSIRLAAFSNPMSSCLEFNIRVYVMPDTKDAFEHVVATESRMDGRLLDNVKQTLLRDGGSHPLCFCIEELSWGWRSRNQNKFQEIPFSHIWSGNQANLLHCAFTLEHVDPTRQSVSCKIVAYQDSFYSSRQILQVASDRTESNKHPNGPPSTNRLSSISSSNGMHLDPLQTVFRIPNHCRPRICALLDTPNHRGNDWRMLARQLAVDRYINYFATKPSPTDAILDLWEARNRDENALTDLKNALRAMGRLDVVAFLDQDAKPAWL